MDEMEGIPADNVNLPPEPPTEPKELLDDVTSEDVDLEEKPVEEAIEEATAVTPSPRAATSSVSTVYVSCSDVSLKYASDVPMSVKVTSGSPSPDGKLPEGMTLMAKGNTKVYDLPHENPFPDYDNDDDDEDEDHMREKCEWDVAPPVMKLYVKNNERRSSYKVGWDAGVRDNGRRDSKKALTRYSVDILEKDPGRYSVEVEEKRGGRVSKRYCGEIAEKNGLPKRRFSRGVSLRDQDLPEEFRVRKVAKDPADIPKRTPGAADIDVVGTLKRYVRRIAEDDSETGKMRKRILDYIGKDVADEERDNRINEERYRAGVRDRDPGGKPKRYSTGFTKTHFGVGAPPTKVFLNQQRNSGYQNGFTICPTQRKSLGLSKSKTFSTVSRTMDSVTETFYTYDAEGGEEIRVLVDGWPKLEVTRASGSDLYEGNWVDDPESRSFGEKCRTSSVIEANDCKIRMDRQCDGKEESIALYKDGVLICKAGRKIV